MGHHTPHIPLALALSLIALLAFAPTASADLIIGSPGIGAGQYQQPSGVAVDTSNGQIYVADKQNNRVDVFESDGTFLRAFGWGVRSGDISTTGLDSCTTECQPGFPGSGAGQISGGTFNSGFGIAVDSSSHDVYVAEESNSRVQKFDPEGHFLLMFGKGVNSGTSGNPDLCTSAGPPTDVCRAGSEGGGLGQFNEITGVAVDSGGVVYVADHLGAGASRESRVQEYSSAGASVKQLLLKVTGGAGNGVGIAVDSVGDIYFGTNSGTGAVRKYDPSGSPITAWGEGGEVDPSFNITAIALDPAGDLFVADQNPNGQAQTIPTQIIEFSPSGAKSRVFFGNGTLERPPIALAFHHTATGDLYAAERGFGTPNPARVVQLTLPPPGPLLVPGSTKASPVGNVKATFRVEFNSEGKASKARFQYITKKKFEEDGDSFGTGTLETPDSAPTAADFENHAVSAANTCTVPTEATCLKPETSYYFRAIASNADGEVKSEEAEFTTLPAVQILATWVTDVGTDTARLHAEANPLGFATSGRFEYVDDAHFKSEGGFAGPHTQATAAIDFGSGEETLARAAQATGLQPGITYHYRLLAEDPFFAPVASQAHTLTTFASPAPGEEACPANAAFRSGASAALPDCRAYEMVSPLDKNNGDVFTRINLTGYPTALDQSSATVPADGPGFTYSSYRAFANPQSAPYTNQFLARREEGKGWQSESIDPPRGGLSLLFNELENEYQAFSPDLSESWLRQETEPTLDPCAPAGFADLYRRDSSTGALTALSCAHPSPKFEELTAPSPPSNFAPELEGFSADGSHAVFRIDDALTSDASGATVNESRIRPIYQVYESTGAAQLHLISVLPDGKASDEDASAGTAINNNVQNHNRLQIVAGALSQDGTRVFWSTGIGGQGPIYLRTNADQKQSNINGEGKCSQPTRACTITVSAGEPALFQGANPQGTKALFKVSAGPNQGDLYRFDSGAQPPASQLIAKGVVENILGASEDLARIYFASEEATAQEEAEGALKGQPNVYLYDEGATRFLGIFSADDLPTGNLGGNYGSPIETTPIFHTARVSPDGQSLVFMSNNPALAEQVAGYDNTDVKSGQPDAEVYLYDATANEGKGRLRCVSCNPSGARPSGSEIAQGLNGKAGPFGAAKIPLPESQLYQPRYLSDDGRRVFFNSFDALALGDTNGKEDAYQWEEAGTGSCKEESPSYVPASEGCLSLLSSGQSSDDSEFLDASASGSDAFFTTVEGLLPQDYGLVDVYDARVGGGFPPPPSQPVVCEGEACQAPPQAPDDPTPASASGEGAGNVKERANSRCAKGKARRKGRCVAKKHKRAKRHSVRHAGNKRRAER